MTDQSRRTRNTLVMGMLLLAALASPTLAQTNQNKSPLDRTKTKLPPAPATTPPRTTNPTTPGTVQLPRQGQVPSQTPAQVVDQQRAAAQNQRRFVPGSVVELDKDTKVEIGPIVYLKPEKRTVGDIKADIVQAARNGELPKNSHDLQALVQGNARTTTTANVEEIRREYHDKGYMEGKLGDDRLVFIKTKDWGAFYTALGAMKQENPTPAVGGYTVNELVNDINRYDDDRCSRPEYIVPDVVARNSCTPGACQPKMTSTLDPFVMKCALEPEKPMTATEAAELDMEPLDKADFALRDGRIDTAVQRYQEYVYENPEDAAAVRGLALALLQSKRFNDGIDRMFEAYQADPMLASQPFDPAMLQNRGSATLSDMVQRAVALGNRSKDPKALLTGVVLMQAQGKNKEAAKILKRAGAKGLSDRLAREFSLTLSDPEASTP